LPFNDLALRKKNKVPAYRQFPILNWVLDYQKDWLPHDLTAGLITAAVVIPKAMAYATIAGLPVQVGLYTVLVPMLIYALFGTSRPLSLSTTTTLAILVAAEFGQIAPAGDQTVLTNASATLTLLVGAVLLFAALLRLGFIANFISEPVLVGFKAGIGLVIVLDQLPKLLGVHLARGTFIHNLLGTLSAIPHASMPTLAVGIIMIVLLLGIEQFFPRAPAPLIVVAIAIAGVRLFGLESSRRGNCRCDSPRFTFFQYSGLLARRKALAWSVGHCADEFYRDDRCGARLCDCGGAAPSTESGVGRDRIGECSRRAIGRDAVGRRHHTDCGEPPGGCAFAAR